MNMKDIARALGVSQTTVSLTLNDKGDRYGIAAETQGRIREYVRSVGYVPDSNAAAMASGANRHVGILIPSDSPALTEAQRAIFFGLLQTLHREGICPLIQAIDEDTCYDGVRFLAGRKVEDLVVIGFTAAALCEACTDLHPLLRRRRVYFVDYMFSATTVASPFPTVVRIGIDRAQSFNAALGLLRAHGHRTIGAMESVLRFIDRPEDISYLTLPVDHQEDDIFERGRRMLPEVIKAMQQGCTAVILRDDMLAFGLITALQEAKYRVPADLSIIGFDNIPASAYIAVPLTTIEVPVQGMLDALCARLIGDEKGTRDCLLPGRLIQRSSVAAIVTRGDR